LSSKYKENSVCHIVDGLPITTAYFKRAKKRQNFKAEAGYGYCASKSQTYYGFKGHLLFNSQGKITSFTFTEAAGSERETVWELTKGIHSTSLLGDKGYLSASLKKDLRDEQDIRLETPVRHNMTIPLPKAERTFLNKTRRLVEKVIGQLTGQFKMNKVWARKSWTLVGRSSQKMLAHGLGMLTSIKLNNKPLQLEHVMCV
jgi:hypothetical protein